MDKTELENKIFQKGLNRMWHKSDDPPRFCIDMLVVDWRRTHPHVTIERYDEDMKQWLKNHPTAMWCGLYDVLPNYEEGF